MSRNMIRLIPLLIMLVLSIALASGIFTRDKKLFEDASLVGRDIIPFRVPTLGSEIPTFAPRDWRGKVVVLNIFASWCEPCVAEHQLWMKLSKTGKVNLYGLAWKDTPEKVSAWLTKHGNPYHLIGIDQHGETTIPLALTGIPETFIIDQTGSIYFHHQAPVTQDIMDSVILPLAEKLTNGELKPVERGTGEVIPGKTKSIQDIFTNQVPPLEQPNPQPAPAANAP